MIDKILLKDLLFNKAKVTQLADEIARQYPSFKRNDFIREVVSKFPELELKQRISWIRECLRNYLLKDYQDAVDIILSSLPKPNNPNLTDNDFGDFIYAPYADYVAAYGCNKSDLQLSLKALKEITQRFSAEDAIRYFINAFPKETMEELLRWSKDSHYHIRRLTSEGTRPKLPWAQKINISIEKAVPILNNLFTDKTRFVTRSVANHLNDISKINPDLVIELLKKWQKSGKQDPKEMDYIIRHSLRTLVKKGNSNAINLLGFNDAPQVTISKFLMPRQVKMNTALEFSFSVQSEEDTNLIIDYIIYFQNKSGKLNSKKVFKLTKLALKKDQSSVISKRHMLYQHMTTRTLYPGKHEIEIQINGKAYLKHEFLLT